MEADFKPYWIQREELSIEAVCLLLSSDTQEAEIKIASTIPYVAHPGMWKLWPEDILVAWTGWRY